MVRFKNRYLLVQVQPAEVVGGSVAVAFQRSLRTQLTASQAASYLRSSIETNFGISAAARTQQSFSVKYANASTGVLILRAARDDLSMVWASMTFLTGLPGLSSSSSAVRAVWRVIGVSGTIKACQKQAIRYSIQRIRELGEAAKSAEEKSQIEAMLDTCKRAISSIEA